MSLLSKGKTTLLNVLNFRNNGSLKVEGPVRINGRLVKSIDEIASVSAYVQQDDMFVETLTVSEHLIFHVQFHLRHSKDSVTLHFLLDRICDLAIAVLKAELRMGRPTTKKQRNDRIEELLICVRGFFCSRL